MDIGPQELTALLAQHRDYLSGAGGQQLDLSGKAFADCDFSGETLHGIVGARAAVFTRCNFSGADLYGISFQDSTIVACDLNAAMLGKCEFWGVTISDSTFEDATLIRAEFSGATIRDTRFAGANLLGGVAADSSLTRCVFDRANVTGAAISGNQEIDVSWQNVTGLVVRAAVAPGARTAAGRPMVEQRLFSAVDQLVSGSLAEMDAVAKTLGIALHASGETAHIRLFASEPLVFAPGSDFGFTKAELRQNKHDGKRVILTAQLADSACVTRESVLKKFPSPTISPPSPESENSQAYISLTLKGARVSFGFTQDRPDRVASLTIDQTELF